MQKKTNTTTMQPQQQNVKIETLKVGELFMVSDKYKPTENNVYEYGGYCRQNKKYTGTKFNDFCSQRYFKKGTTVFIDFEF